MSEETIPKQLDTSVVQYPTNQEQESIFEEDTPITNLRQPPSLDEIIPVNATSAEKKLIFTESTTIFSGCYDPAAVRCVLASLDEADLRVVRTQLHSGLQSVVLAAAGRPLSRRVQGNIASLADDCWALGYSAAQGVLTQRANGATLKPAGRDPLPPPGPAPPSDGSSTTTSATAASLEAIIATQLRLEQSVTHLRTGRTTSEARLKSLEDESARLREQCAIRDTRIAQLEMLLDSGLDSILERNSQPLHESAEPEAVPTLQGSTIAGESTSVGQDATAAAAPCRGSEGQVDASAVAREIAAGIDLRALGGAIASALQWRAGESEVDSEPDLPVPTVDLPRRRLGTANRQSRSSAAPSETRPGGAATGSEMASADPPVCHGQVTGTGPASDLIMDPTARPESNRKKFILEGFRLDVADRTVRDLVWEVVRNLHDFQRLPRRDAAAQPAKAYLIVVDAADEAQVMNPASWPAGLTVRYKSNNATNKSNRRMFRNARSSVHSQAPVVYSTTELHQDRTQQTATPRSRDNSPENRDRRQDGARQRRETEAPRGATTGYSHLHGEWQTVSSNRRRQRWNAPVSRGHMQQDTRDWRSANRRRDWQNPWQQVEPNNRHL